MTLKDLVTLARAIGELDTSGFAALDATLKSAADETSRDGLTQVTRWLEQVEACSGNDEELADDVGGALAYARSALAQKGASE